MNKNITIYVSQTCPYCKRAKQLLKSKGVTEMIEIDITNDIALKNHMIERSAGRKTVPQIFLGDLHVGGCDDLYILEEQGKLDEALSNLST